MASLSGCKFFYFCSYYLLHGVRKLYLVLDGEIFCGQAVFRDFRVIQAMVSGNCLLAGGWWVVLSGGLGELLRFIRRLSLIFNINI